MKTIEIKTLTALIAVLVLMQNVVRAEEPWRFINLADWHGAETYVQPDNYPGFAESLLAGLKMLKANYGGELVILPGDACKGHWDTRFFIAQFSPGLSPEQSILQAGALCYTGMVNAFGEAGYSKLLMAVGDHELGDNPWPPGDSASRCQQQFREAFAKGFNIHPDGTFIYDQPIGKAPSRPLGTKYETTSYAYQHKNVLFVTMDVFHQEDPHKRIGRQGSVTGAVVGKHLEWLDHVLSEANKDDSIKHIFVQSHLPVLQPVRRVNSSGMLMDGEMESDFWKTMRKHKVDIYFAGEVHSNTVTKDPKSDLIQVVTRARWLNNFATVDLTDDVIDLTLYNQISPKASDGKFEEYGRLVIDKSSGKKTFRDEGEFTFLDRDAPMIHFDFEENFAMKDRIVLGFSLRQGGVPFKSEVNIGGISCDRSFRNQGAFGRNYDAQNGNIELTEGPRGKAGVFHPKSQMAVYGAGPYSYGNVVSYALWMKTTSEEDMMLINTGRGGLKSGLMNLNLNNARPELLMAEDVRLIAKSKKLNDGKWHHIAVSMPRKDCRLSGLQFYVDGQPVESDVHGKDAPIHVSMVNKVSVGGAGHEIGKSPFAKFMHSKLGIKPFAGELDEVAVWARALTATEIAELAK
ncbi:LamG domain-containing protein [Verrucomicrobia bacterium]|nr:LamG domain-containing protein [Verrucomicrobiota bacterium]